MRAEVCSMHTAKLVLCVGGYENTHRPVVLIDTISSCVAICMCLAYSR